MPHLAGMALDRKRLVLYSLLAAAGLSSAWLTRLSPFALLLSLIAFFSLPRGNDSGRRALFYLALTGGLGACVGFVRFLIHEAVPGIVEGGTRATGAAAVSRLREILFAEDVMRRSGSIDPDGDRIGSAALIDEMTGRIGLRGGARLVPPVLERYPRSVDTALGPAVEISGYFFVVCLPKRGGGWTAKPGDAVDEERAERSFLAYAWPSAGARGLVDAYFLDERERILFAPNGAPEAVRPRIGPDRPPACDDAIASSTREQWQAWRGKRPRDTLPGDRP
jgi:hypothetical protein